MDFIQDHWRGLTIGGLVVGSVMVIASVTGAIFGVANEMAMVDAAIVDVTHATMIAKDLIDPS